MNIQQSSEPAENYPSLLYWIFQEIAQFQLFVRFMFLETTVKFNLLYQNCTKHNCDMFHAFNLIFKKWDIKCHIENRAPATNLFYWNNILEMDHVVFYWFRIFKILTVGEVRIWSMYVDCIVVWQHESAEADWSQSTNNLIKTAQNSFKLTKSN